MGFVQLEFTQLMPVPIEELWDFISSPRNLKEITPVSMGFEIVSKNLPAKIYPGMLIAYKVKPLFGIPVTWVTEITQVEDKRFFIDLQRVGPFAFWHHQHWLEQQADGVLMRDIVSYKPPFGFLGTFANALVIKKQLMGIFSYREEVLKHRFSKRID